MRNIVLGICSLGIFFMVLLIGFTVSGRQKRTAELETALNLSMEQALWQIEYAGEERPRSDEELCAVFEQLFLAQILADASYQIKILDVDVQKGILSVMVTENYRHLNGRTGSITAQKTAVCERAAEGMLYGRKLLTFYVGEEIYRQYELEAASRFTVPKDPQEEGRMFAGWWDAEDGKRYGAHELSEMILERDRDFYAVWEYEE